MSLGRAINRSKTFRMSTEFIKGKGMNVDVEGVKSLNLSRESACVMMAFHSCR